MDDRTNYYQQQDLPQAAAVLNREPISVTLRYLQTLIEIGTEQNTTIVFPLPLDLLGPSLQRPSADRGRSSAAPVGVGQRRWGDGDGDGKDAHNSP